MILIQASEKALSFHGDSQGLKGSRESVLEQFDSLIKQ